MKEVRLFTEILSMEEPKVFEIFLDNLYSTSLGTLDKNVKFNEFPFELFELITFLFKLVLLLF